MKRWLAILFLVGCGSKDEPSRPEGTGNPAPTDPLVAWDGIARHLGQLSLDTIAGKPVTGRFICPSRRFRGAPKTFDELRGLNRVVLVTTNLKFEIDHGGAKAERGALALTIQSGVNLPARFANHDGGQSGKEMLEVDTHLPEALAMAKHFRSIVQKPGCPGYSPTTSRELVKQLGLPSWFESNFFDDRPPNPDRCKWAADYFKFAEDRDYYVGLADDASVDILLTDGNRYGQINATLERQSAGSDDSQRLCFVIDGGRSLTVK